jgi:hypothetical protein
VRVGRISGSPLHLSLSHLQSYQLRNRSLSNSVGNLPMESGELQGWSLPLLLVRFRNDRAADNGSACYSQAASLTKAGVKASGWYKVSADCSDFPVHNKRCLWMKVEKWGRI